MGPVLQENVICNIFKPNALFAKVVEDVGKLGKDLAKQDHIVVVGGAGNNLDIKQYYSIEKGLNFTNVGFANLLRRHDKPWMNSRVRSVYLQLNKALMGCDMSHTDVIDTGTLVTEEYITHDVHVNYRGKMRLTYLIAESICSGYVQNVNSRIPVITHAGASPFLA
jgi:hypothetical protein